MVANAALKKVVSISEGNFHGCYASNKAEKFKFRRLSLGLESCAQAQALKMRKQEKELHKVLHQLEKEKEKRHCERKDNQIYLHRVYDSDASRAESFAKPSTNRISLDLNSGEVVYCNSPNASTYQCNKRNILKTRNARRSSVCVSDSQEVIPFYMQNSYANYHNVLYNSNLSPSSNELTNRKSSVDCDQPSWKTTTSLSRLKQGRTVLNIPKSDYPLQTSKSNEPSGDIFSKDNIPSNFLNSSTYNLSQHRAPSVLENIDKTAKASATMVDRQSVLTPLERQELARHTRNRGNYVRRHEEQKAKYTESHKERRHTMDETGRAFLLKKIIQNRIKRGEAIEDLVKDKTLDNSLDLYDEGRLCPAYNSNTKMTFQDFRSLRQCKYLRLSDLNRKSLKQATLEALIN
ncbi:uncharacterized protein LOC130645318 [Hydractinia symbiolongicarpus]|uniref:uncharacterized protein LOC130645318 n=1 Tax=Hydractinia symbiolongicarpus TaxID=13093 RepID=UPI00254B3015|nr:uncharacterized protein LOC130645318 [Hydractinia symbiolongicarpus]